MVENEHKLPKVLVIGINAWREDGTAHTLMDIFRCWNPDRLALIYTRADLPNTQVCKHYFQISESEVLKSVLKPSMRVGREVKCSTDNQEAKSEHARYQSAHRRKSALLPLAREMVWKLGHWKSKALKEFIDDFNPDLLFVPIYPTVYMGRLQRYIIQLTKNPTVCYLADDNYSYDSCQGVFSYLHRFWLRQQVRPLAEGCKEMFVIVEKEKEDTDQRFGTDSVILTKSIDFSKKSFASQKPNAPLKFVYTGSMVIGRDQTLAMLADAINEVNGAYPSTKAELFIYSQSEPSSAIRERIDREASHFCGRISREEVLRVQQKADVVVFAEALVGKEANAAKLSFSTKITDYISNGKCVLAIGKEDIAPIDYFRRNDAALIARNANELKEQVRRIVETPTLINEYGEKAFNCAVKNHEKGMMTQRFIRTMMKAYNH